VHHDLDYDSVCLLISIPFFGNSANLWGFPLLILLRLGLLGFLPFKLLLGLGIPSSEKSGLLGLFPFSRGFTLQFGDFFGGNVVPPCVRVINPEGVSQAIVGVFHRRVGV